MESDRTYTLDYIEKLAAHRRPGFVSAIKAMGVWNNDQVTLTAQERAEIRRRFLAPDITGLQVHGTAAAPPVLRDTMPADGPGGRLHQLIAACGFQPAANCGCAKFARQMNQWGWIGCTTTHRKEIVTWLVAQAKRSGVTLTSATVTGLVLAALKHAAGTQKHAATTTPGTADADKTPNQLTSKRL